MAMKKTKLARVDPQFLKEIRELAKVRIQKGLMDPREMSDREITSLIRKTYNWNWVKEELRKKPKKIIK